MTTEDPTRMVTVCDACRRAQCWHGELFCEDARSAGTVEVPRGELVREGNEDPSWFSDKRLDEICGEDPRRPHGVDDRSPHFPFRNPAPLCGKKNPK